MIQVLPSVVGRSVRLFMMILMVMPCSVLGCEEGPGVPISTLILKSPGVFVGKLTVVTTHSGIGDEFAGTARLMTSRTICGSWSISARTTFGVDPYFSTKDWMTSPLVVVILHEPHVPEVGSAGSRERGLLASAFGFHCEAELSACEDGIKKLRASAKESAVVSEVAGAKWALDAIAIPALREAAMQELTSLTYENEEGQTRIGVIKKVIDELAVDRLMMLIRSERGDYQFDATRLLVSSGNKTAISHLEQLMGSSEKLFNPGAVGDAMATVLNWPRDPCWCKRWPHRLPHAETQWGINCIR